MDTDVLIIGGGLAGLSCAKTLQDYGIAFLLLEASETAGGRIRTDQVDGFLQGACRILVIEREKVAERGLILAISPAHSGTMVQESGEIWTA